MTLLALEAVTKRYGNVTAVDGVATQRITTVGYGEEFPVAGNTTETDRALNRRVEIYIAESGQPVRSRR